MIKKFICWLIIGLFPVFLLAQTLEVGIGIGGVNYWGDLNTPELSTNLTNARFGAQLSGRIFYTSHLAGRLNIMVGGLEGDDSKSNLDWQQLRNLSFKSNVLELALLGEFYLFGYEPGSTETFFSPYATAGLCVFSFNPYTDYKGQQIELQPLGTEGQSIPGYDDKYSTTSFALMFGGGAKIVLTDQISVNLDVIARRAFTDYIDDVSGDYVNYNELLNGNGLLSAQLGNRMGEFLGQEEPIMLQTGSQRGGSFVNDYYLTGMITVNYIMGSGSGYGSRRKGVYNGQCPTF